MATDQAIDGPVAIQAANAFSAFQKLSAGFSSLKYYSTYETGIAQPSVCDVSHVEVNVVFGGNDSRGFAYLVVSENESTLLPTGLEVQQNPPVYSFGCIGSPPKTCTWGSWAGYEVYANSQISTNIWSITSVLMKPRLSIQIQAVWTMGGAT